MISLGLLLAWWWQRRLDRRRAVAALEVVAAARDELRSRIEGAAPLWRREDSEFPGSRW